MDIGNSALIFCFSCLPNFNRNFLRAVVCTPLCSFFWIGRGLKRARSTLLANYSLSCTGPASLGACLRLGLQHWRRIAEAGNDAVRLKSPAPQKSCPFAVDWLGALASWLQFAETPNSTTDFICLLNMYKLWAYWFEVIILTQFRQYIWIGIYNFSSLPLGSCRKSIALIANTL